MSNYQSDLELTQRGNKKIISKEVPGKLKIAEEPLAITYRVRNTAIPDTYFSAANKFDVNDEALSLRQELRKHSKEDRIRSHKSEFISLIREKPEDFYEAIVKGKPKVDLYTLKPEVAALRKKYLSDFMDGHFGSIQAKPEPVGVGEMWWGETWFTVPNRIGMFGVFNEAGLLLFGNLSWDDGDLFQTGYHVFSSFFLDPQRMPAANHVRSSPGGVLSGQMFGFTGGAASFFLGGAFEGDQWSKCKLKLHQRAFAINPNNPADIIPAAAPSFNEMQIIDVDDSNDFQEGSLPGGLPYIPIDIHLIKNRILRIDLEIDIFMALEGEASIRFGGVGHSNPALHQWTQWTLQPL